MFQGSTITLFRVVNESFDVDEQKLSFDPEIQEMVFKDRGGYFVCDGIVRYTLPKADSDLIENYHVGMSIAGPDQLLNVFAESEYWTRDRKAAEQALALLKHGYAEGLRIAKRRMGKQLAHLVDGD